MKQISCESGFSASARPCWRAISRTSGLVSRPKRKERVGKLLLREAEEEIGLVLGQIGGALENPALRVGVELVNRIMAGGDAVGADAARGLEQLVELEVVVAERAWDGRAPGEVLGDKWPDDCLFEALLLIDDVVGNLEVLGHAAGIVHIVKRATAASLRRVGDAVLAGQARLVPQLERQADDRIGRVRRPSPEWASIAATVEESTPPDMATAMVVRSVMGFTVSQFHRK